MPTVINNINYGISAWYPTLADHTFPTTFVKLKESDIELIANGITQSNEVDSLINRLGNAQSAFHGATFVLSDTVAPTDTPRFIDKKGAVHSPQSAWNNLVLSAKVRAAAKRKDFEFICIRPFRNMTYLREFRLFIYGKTLKLMSQTQLDRPYKRLTLRKEFWWGMANEFIDDIAWLLPDNNIVMDIYFTSKDEIMILDFNPWGNPTDPLLAKEWTLDWNINYGLKLLE
ncbi:MAG TPA: hypothetical protein DD381_02400 [Lentisphaeria bacterium]|nr:MAG: hypothetical protein A2X47_08635 [Lentisphaerae bacterium GWF2_38_69]HBM15186.1 hypothetical protein [Lentisphaeria bacterium]